MDSKYLFRRFSNLFWLGILLLIMSYIIKFDLACYYKDCNLKLFYLIDIVASFTLTIGIALLVAIIFSYTIESSSFISYIERILKKIVISKDFLNNLDAKGKKEALELILTPSESQTRLYSNINEYFLKHIDESMQLFDTNFKSNFVYEADAYIDSRGVIRMTQSMIYKLYTTKTEFAPVILGFENESSELVEMSIHNDSGERYKVNLSDIHKTHKVEESGFEWYEYMYEIDKNYSKSKYITIIQNFIEYGDDHWQLLNHKSIIPTDSIVFNLRCHDEITIKESMIFDIDKNYSVTQSSDNKTIRIVCDQWMKRGTGFCVLVSIDK